MTIFAKDIMVKNFETIHMNAPVEDAIQMISNSKPRKSGQKNKKIQSVMLKNGNLFEPKEVTTGLSNFKETEVLSGLEEGDILGVPMSSRLKDSNDRRTDRMRSTRTFGTSK